MGQENGAEGTLQKSQPQCCKFKVAKLIGRHMANASQVMQSWAYSVANVGEISLYTELVVRWLGEIEIKYI